MSAEGLIRDKELSEALLSECPENEELLRDELMSIQLGVVSSAAVDAFLNGDSVIMNELLEPF